MIQFHVVVKLFIGEGRELTYSRAAAEYQEEEEEEEEEEELEDSLYNAIGNKCSFAIQQQQRRQQQQRQ